MAGHAPVPPTLKRIKASALQTPDDGPNHTTVLRQAKESIEVAQRLRGDVGDSYVRVSELVALGLASIANGQVQLSNGATAGQLSGPPSTVPSAAGSLELTDGTTDLKAVTKITTTGATVGGTPAAATLTVTGSSPLTTKGDVFGYDTANNRIPVGADGTVLTADSTQTLGVRWASSGGGSTPVPATIPDLVLWYKADEILKTAGFLVPFIGNSTPWAHGAGKMLPITPGTTGAVISATQLNSLNVLTFAGTGSERYSLEGTAIGATLVEAVMLHKHTVFAVVKPSTLTGGAGFGWDIICGAGNSLEIRVDTAGKLNLVKTNVSLIATSTTAVATVGSWSQFNSTYDDSTGAYAFRSNRTANSSGTNVVALSAPETGLLWFIQNSGINLDWHGDVAEIIVYDRVLTGTEITNIENYLHTKWGV